MCGCTGRASGWKRFSRLPEGGGMREEELHQLLQRADRALQTGDSTLLSSQHIGQLARHRVRKRRVLAGAASTLVVILSVAAVSLKLHRSSMPSPPESPTVAKSSTEPVNAGLEVKERIALEAQMRLDHRRRVNAEKSMELIDAAQERNQAARIMVMMAARRGEMGRQEAVDLYSRTIAMFPDTPSARVAREALGTLERQN
jgi:hypothetical protein